MAFLVRKIEYAKWRQNKILEGEPISADAITHDLRTSTNCLSVWEISTKDEIKKAVMAIISAGSALDAVDFILLPKEKISEKGLEIQESDGVTPYKEFIERHRDISGLCYESLGILSEIIVDNLQKSPMRFTRTELREILSNGVNNGHLNVEDLHENLRNKIS